METYTLTNSNKNGIHREKAHYVGQKYLEL